MKSRVFTTTSILLSVVALFLSSCRTTRPESLHLQDSVRVEIKERRVVHHDTIFFEIAAQSQSIETLLDTSILINNFCRSMAMILPSGALSHSLETLPQTIQEPIVQEIIASDSVVYRERLITKLVYTERELSRWQEFQIMGFYLLLALVIILVIIIRIM